MNINDLMNKIDNYTVKEKAAKEKALLDKYHRIDDLKDAIQERSNQINNLIKLGNYALKNNVIVSFTRYSGSPSLETRECGYFFTDSFHHRLGFVWNKEENKITHLGIKGGGAWNCNLKVNGDVLMVDGDEEFVLKKFVDELDQFEKDLENYIIDKTK